MPSPLVPSDLLRFALVSEPQISPDGSAVYYRRAWFDAEADESRGSIRRVARDGADRPFTSGTNDRLPRVAPDGSAVAFVGDRDGKPRLFVLRLDGGEAAPLAEGFEKIVGLAWSPDSARLAFVATAPFDAATARAFHDEKTGARHIRMLPFKSDADGLLDGVRKHLFVVDAVGDPAPARQITHGDYDVSGPAWSPDGKTIAFWARLGAADAESATALSDIHLVEVASGAVTTLTRSEGPAMTPAFSRDGKEIAYVGHRHGDDGGGRFDLELFVIAAEGGEPRSLSADSGRTIGDTLAGDLRSGGAPAPPVWTTGDREIVVQVCDEGATVLRGFARNGTATRVIAGGERHVFAFSVANDGAIALAFSTPTVPNEIALVEPYGGERTLTKTNPWLAEKTVVAPKRYRPRADDGTTLDAWLLAPSRPRETPVPLVLEVHGGPHGAYGHTFFLEFQVLAAQGIAVAYGNPRGSQSYGTGYSNAILGDWGGLDVADVLRILDGALELGAFDTTRIGVAGGSYGGFMTSWLMGHSDRFAAGVSMRAVNDFVSEIGASDVGWFLEKELQAPYASDAGRTLFDRSPMRAASAIAAPLLIEHSERDYRCPIDQGEQLFTLLRRLGTSDAEFVRFTQTGHEMSRGGKPRSRILRLRAIAHWFIRHLKPAGVAAEPNEAGSLFRPLAGEEPLDPTA